MSVGAIVTLNRFTELATGTHVTGGRRAFDVRSRVTINFLKDSHDLACRSWRLLASRLGGVPTTRRRSDSTGPVVVTIPTAYKRLSPMPARRSVPRLGLAAGSHSRPRAGLLTYHFSTSYQATMAGRA